MKKIGGLLLICFVPLLFFGLFNGFDSLTGRIFKENIIVSISPQGELNNKAFHINVFTSEKANCMYNLGLENVVSFKYYNTMAVTGEFQHSQLLKDVKGDSYTLSIKCTGRDGFSHTEDVDLVVKIPETCVPYCEYNDICDEYASDGCDLLCKRNTDGLRCGENKVCNGGFCVDKEIVTLAAVEISEQPAPIEEPVIAKDSRGLLSRFFSFLRGIFR